VGAVREAAAPETTAATSATLGVATPGSGLNPAYTFESFVEGKSNQFALAAARQVAEIPVAPTTPCSSMGGGFGQDSFNA